MYIVYCIVYTLYTIQCILCIQEVTFLNYHTLPWMPKQVLRSRARVCLVRPHTQIILFMSGWLKEHVLEDCLVTWQSFTSREEQKEWSSAIYNIKLPFQNTNIYINV